jgi:hypothetical protein
MSASEFLTLGSLMVSIVVSCVDVARTLDAWLYGQTSLSVGSVWKFQTLEAEEA